ncbi:hypothetical protein OIU84_025454 [Salix udensis]|uniref:Uncharacterized protein n=1 Tax=Salix udensis TaxID=889485 RepID=A0AAD6KLV9_9ROSI|nr:hypothetical protein OIU84_025454 [Salix udensis]
MESSLNHDTSWTAATNWTIAGGSLVDSLAFESSLSPITNEDNNDQDQFSTVDSKSKSPVILYAPTSDPAPCEITINFAQKHEVRQVYVRSTARVYEIYCAPEQQSSTEYLCTVRCGIAARDEEVLLATNAEAVLAHARSSIQEPAEEKLRNGSSLSPNEDDWVEVKALDSPLAINRNSSASNSDIKPERNSQNLQVFYEATAEITDANPSTSLTLRLLSLQNKGYVCVDEVYVFGDPADASNSDNQVGPMENSAGNSLMAMLVPAFFQMSKSKGIGGGEDKYNIDTRERQNSQDNGSKAAAPADAEKKIQEEERLQEAAGPTSKSVEHEISQQVSNTESKHNISHNHFEGVLDVLVSRVNRIEDLLLRFEESMMKPINSIDEYLLLIFHAVNQRPTPPYNSISRDISYAACEANRSNSPSSLTSVLPDVASVSVNDIKIQPGLVVTAPEFSNYDDEEEDHAVESVKESPKDKQKHTMSIDDALAYALAGFLSSTSIQSQKYSPTLSVNTPDFSSIEENIDEHMTPPIAESERNMDPPTCFL